MQVFIGLGPDLMPFLGLIEGIVALQSGEDQLHINQLLTAIEGRLCQNCCHQPIATNTKKGNKKPQFKRLLTEDFLVFRQIRGTL